MASSRVIVSTPPSFRPWTTRTRRTAALNGIDETGARLVDRKPGALTWAFVSARRPTSGRVAVGRSSLFPSRHINGSGRTTQLAGIAPEPGRGGPRASGSVCPGGARPAKPFSQGTNAASQTGAVLDPAGLNIYRRHRQIVLADSGGLCQSRSPNRTGRATSIDHIKPISQGGSHNGAGLRTTRRGCNYGNRQAVSATRRRQRRIGRRLRA